MKIPYLSNFFSIREFICLKLTLSQQGISRVEMLHISVDKELNVTVKESGSFASLHLGIERLKENKLPMVVHFEGKGIINKVSPHIEEDREKLLSMHIPNALPQDFVINYFTSEQQQYISIVRLDALGQAIDQFGENKGKVIFLSFGNAIKCLIGLLDSPDLLNRNLDGVQLDNRNEISTVSKLGEEELSQTIKVTDTQLRIAQLPAFLNGIAFMNREQGLPLQIETPTQIADNHKEFLAQKLNKILLPATLSILVIILALNAVLFFDYTKKNEELTAQYQINGNMAREYQRLLTDHEEKEKIIRDSGIGGSASLAMYADLLAGTITSSVQLTHLNVFPVKTKKGAKKDLSFDHRTILVTGRCKDAAHFGSWLIDLSKEDWVEGIGDQSFVAGEGSTRGTFKLSIQINTYDR